MTGAIGSRQYSTTGRNFERTYGLCVRGSMGTRQPLLGLHSLSGGGAGMKLVSPGSRAFMIPLREQMDLSRSQTWFRIPGGMVSNDGTSTPAPALPTKL